MPTFLCLQRTLPGADAPSAKPSPAEMQAMYAAFNAWRETFRANLTDLGGRLGRGKLVGAPAATDGPFVEVKELVGGYMIVSADSLDEAIRVASACPGLVRPGSGVDVRPELLVRWMGDQARLEAVDGGEFSVDINGVLIRGHFVHVDRPRLLEVAWGEAGNAAMPPGATTCA